MLRRSLSSHTTKRTQWDFNPKNKLLKALMSLAQVLQLTGGPKRDVRQSPQPQPGPTEFKVLYICGNYFAILGRLDRRFQVPRRPAWPSQFSAHDHSGCGLQLLGHHRALPLALQGRRKITEYVSQSMRDAAKDAADFLYAPGTDTFPEDGPEMPSEYSTSTKGPKDTTIAYCEGLSSCSE